MLMFIFFSTGLAVLLCGMQKMRRGLEGAALTGIKRALAAATGTPIMAALTGMLLTLLVQSSTAVTVLTVSFVNAGLMNLVQAIGIILGSNIGTCITAQMMSLDLTKLALPAVLLGMTVMFFGHKHRTYYFLGQGILGFGLVFLGLFIISQAFAPLQDSPWFNSLLASIKSSPLLAVLAGALFSGLIHSSATTTGVVITLSGQGMVDLPTAIALVLGSNIGTCISAVLASLGGTITGKRVAMAHVLLNVFGVLLFLPLLYPFADLVALTADNLPREIANAHTLFNVLSSLMALPLIRPFAHLLVKIIP
ncbi:Na/Pi cotransporter family protein [Desulfolucanica intricata]|uniref:Na/Pi cotransporter family protein n=1 Tax=Desulfolucanica intricata TaxID=1285191 RepID=UPI000829D973|nr:Na/Pi symporter [Desulfolucanica intricata]